MCSGMEQSRHQRGQLEASVEPVAKFGQVALRYLGRSAWYVPCRAFLTLPQQPVDPAQSWRVIQVRQEAGEGTPPRLLVDGVEQPGLAIPLRDVHVQHAVRSAEHTSELQSLMRISYAVFCCKIQHTNSKHKK